MNGGLMIDDLDVEDFLAHYGVKGMRWGQRKAGNGSPITKSYTGISRKPTNNEIIEARKSQAVLGKEFNAAVKASKKKGEKKTTFSSDLLSKILDNDTDPTSIVAAYKTTGEKVSATILGGLIGAYAYSDMRAMTRETNTSVTDYVRKYGKR